MKKHATVGKLPLPLLPRPVDDASDDDIISAGLSDMIVPPA